MSLKKLGQSFSRILSRNLHLTQPAYSTDLREKRLGHVKKSDVIQGERGSYGASQSSIELIDENLMERVFGNMKFKNIPIIHIKCTRNNTKMTVMGGQGNLLASKSAGIEGYKNCRKGTTVAAQAVANRIVTFVRDHEIDMARLVFNGLGPGRDAAYKVLELSGIKIVSLSDKTEAVEPWTRRPRKAKRI